MHFLHNKKTELGFKLHTRLIVQQQNYKQMESFYNLCKTFNADLVEYSRVTNWDGSLWTEEEYKSHDVFHPQHVEYSQANIELAKVKQLPDVWFAGL